MIWLKSSNDNCIWCCSVWAFAARVVFGSSVLRPAYMQCICGLNWLELAWTGLRSGALLLELFVDEKVFVLVIFLVCCEVLCVVVRFAGMAWEVCFF